MRLRIICMLAALLGAGTAVAAEPALVGGIPDLTGPRMLGLSAGLGAAQANDGIFANVAGLAVRQRYSVDANFFVDRRGSETVGQYYGGSIVDSKSSPVTAGFAYARAQKGAHTGNALHLAIAGPVVNKLFFGVGGKYFALKGRDPVTGQGDNVSAATVDAGLHWAVADYVAFGAAGYNLVSIGNERVAPRSAGAGLAIGSDRSFQVAGDWRVDLERRIDPVSGKEKSTNRYAVGAEVLLGDMVPVRAGWQKDDTLETSWWSAGVGLVSQNGVALDVGYRQSLKDPQSRTIAAALRVFLFN